MFRAIYEERKWIRFGSAASATITEKTVEKDNESTAHHIHYEFRPIALDLTEGEPIIDTCKIDEENWLAVQKGDTLTVLYLPDSPDKHELYRFSNYRAL